MYEQIREYLLGCRELSRLCSRDGLIDGETLHFQVLEQDDHGLVASVEFDEIVESTAVPDNYRVSCFGQIRIALDPAGAIRGLEFL